MMTSGMATAAALFPLLLQAAEEAHGAHELNVMKEIVYPFINFGLLVALLVYLVRRPLKDYLLSRSKDLAQTIEQAAHEKQEAEAKALNFDRRLKNIEQEMKDFVDSLQKEGELAKQRIIEEAHASSKRMEETAKLIGNQEYLKATERLKEEAVQLSSEWAERYIRDNLKAQDRERMMEESIQRLEKLA